MKRGTKTNTTKKLINIMFGVPSAIIVASEVEDLRYCWVQFLALSVIVALLWWNRKEIALVR